MQRYLLHISYDGTDFCGWQSQSDGRTVQQTIEKALSILAKQPITIFGSGRTDAGVHAIDQTAHVDFPIQMEPQQIIRGLRSHLPMDVCVHHIEPVSGDFHARYQAFRRTYRYRLCLEKTPFNNRFCSFMPHRRICPETIAAVLPYFEGTHDFTSFSKFNPKIASTVCQMYQCTMENLDNELQFTVSANRFLHHMVRRIVGTAVLIGHHKESPKIIETLFEQKDPRNKLIATAPPQGLYLLKVEYPQN
ncbi:MAG: tRNA pseudouridine(38-40) synthase TruA [Candidatus Cloacimonetes bacterium]|nr:tRNA pseudouridine(38-40) synthase TruA [Candidatus Cloacimonadota bacterium]